MGLQRLLHIVYPPQCLSCNSAVSEDFALCGSCWRETPFITGLCCDACGVPLPGDDPGTPVHCDDCLTIARPWDRGRAAMLYRDNGRKLVLAMKHADRTDLARPAASWLKRAAKPLLQPGMLVAPVPLHWSRLLKRRYNQAALLSSALAGASGLAHCPDLLIRHRDTKSQEGRDRDDRFRNVSEAFKLHPRHAGKIPGRHLLIVDDVMTSGATLAAATEVCRAGGAASVSVIALARVAKGG